MIVATGDRDSTYHQIYKKLGKTCAHSIRWLEIGTSGSFDNLRLIKEDEVDLAFIQNDILQIIQYGEKIKKKKNRLEIFLPLYNEEVHLISKKENLLPFNKRKRIAIWNGAGRIATALRDTFKLKYKKVLFANRKSAMRALERDKVDLIMTVAGQPVKWIQSLSPKKYTLIPLPYADKLNTNNLNLFYTTSSLSSYKNLSKIPIPTIATQSAIITKGPYTPEQKASLIEFKKCALQNLQELKRSSHTHPKWKEVYNNIFPRNQDKN